MKQGSNQRRSRGRNPNGGGRRNSRNHTFESNGPEVKVRGTAQQVLDKYLQLARDVQSGGDRGNAEAYLQFAEHYYRVLNVEREAAEQGEKRTGRGDGRGDGNDQKRVETESDAPRNRHNANPQAARSQDTPPRDPVSDTQSEAAQPKPDQDQQDQGAPRRGRRRKTTAPKPKNEATLAAEAAASNVSTLANDTAKVGAEKKDAQVESKLSSPSKKTVPDDAEEVTANA